MWPSSDKLVRVITTAAVTSSSLVPTEGWAHSRRPSFVDTPRPPSLVLGAGLCLSAALPATGTWSFSSEQGCKRQTSGCLVAHPSCAQAYSLVGKLQARAALLFCLKGQAPWDLLAVLESGWGSSSLVWLDSQKPAPRSSQLLEELALLCSWPHRHPTAARSQEGTRGHKPAPDPAQASACSSSHAEMTMLNRQEPGTEPVPHCGS